MQKSEKQGKTGILSLGLIALAMMALSVHTVHARHIVFTMYTVHRGVMKMTALLDTVQVRFPGSPAIGSLEIQKNGQWVSVGQDSVVLPGYTLHFRSENWNSGIDVPFRVRYDTSTWTGVIRKDPVDKDTVIVAGFTGNSDVTSLGGDISKDDIIQSIKGQSPDLLFFSGDQVYNHTQHYRYWRRFGNDFGELMRDIPTVCLPDDHDVGQANLWGAGGFKSKLESGDDGGYFQTVSYVQMVERAQTSHLPDPYDPTPIQQGIGAYYTHLVWGGVSFAIIEDRKWKTGPQQVLPKMYGPRWDHVTDATINPAILDVAGAKLLGDRQHKFLNAWNSDWAGAEMKCVLQQSVFACASHISGSITYRLRADLDSHGWPQTPRNQALDIIRRSFAFMYCGDQHLATMIHHGIDDWNDAGWSFCVPSIVNHYERWWSPLEAGKNVQAGMPAYTGEYSDGLGNKITLWAAANPGQLIGTPAQLFTRSAGYGIVKFNKKNRSIKMECWPRNTDPRAPGAKQYVGWPRTISQEDNYGRKAVEYLPTLNISGMVDPVVAVIDESTDSVVYTLRINGTTFRPKVFKDGTYSIRVGEFGTSMDTLLKNIPSLPPSETKTISVVFSGSGSIIKEQHAASRGRPKIQWQQNSRTIFVNLPSLQSYLVDVFNTRGVLVISRKVQGPGMYHISIPDLVAGQYAVKVHGENGTAAEKKIVPILLYR